MDIILKWHIWDYNNERFVDITIKWHIWKYDNDRFVDITLKWHIWHYNNDILPSSTPTSTSISTELSIALISFFSVPPAARPPGQVVIAQL